MSSGRLLGELPFLRSQQQTQAVGTERPELGSGSLQGQSSVQGEDGLQG